MGKDLGRGELSFPFLGYKKEEQQTEVGDACTYFSDSSAGGASGAGD